MSKRSTRVSIFIVIAIAMTIALQRSVLLKSAVVDRVSSYVLYPLLIIEQKMVAPVKSYFTEKRTQAELISCMCQLREEKEQLLARTIALEAALRYAKDVEELVGFKSQYEGLHTTLVHVIARNISDQTHFFLVDAGSDKGITKDMVAIYHNGLIGKVEHVYPRYSKVLLITDSSCKVAACCVNTNAIGIHEGANSLDNTVLGRVSHLEKMEVGDLVLSTGQGLIFPRGFGLGKIKSFKPEGLLYQIAVEPLFDLRSINHCFIVKKGVLKKGFLEPEKDASNL